MNVRYVVVHEIELWMMLALAQGVVVERRCWSLCPVKGHSTQKRPIKVSVTVIQELLFGLYLTDELPKINKNNWLFHDNKTSTQLCISQLCLSGFRLSSQVEQLFVNPVESQTPFLLWTQLLIGKPNHSN